MEIIAVSLYFSNFLLSAIAAFLAMLLFRRYHEAGWLLLAVSLLGPFLSLLLRAVHGQQLFPYRTVGSKENGVIHVIYYWHFPGFYTLVVVALLLLIRSARDTRKA